MKKNNKTIGIIGGMGPQASAKFLEVLIDMCAKDLGAKNDEDFPEIILNSIPVYGLFPSTDIKLATSTLKLRIKKLEVFNPAFFAIVCNTAHVLLPDLQKSTNVPFVSIIDEVAKKVKENSITNVGLLSTSLTVKSLLYQKACARRKINVITPSINEQIIVEGVIKNVLAGKIKNDDKQKLVVVAKSLREKGAGGIILGCTELPLIFPKNKDFITFDSIEILAKALLENVFLYEKRN